MPDTFQSHPLAEVLRDLLFDQASGVLSVQGEGFRADLMVESGSVIYCRSDAPDQKLENLLVKWGLIPAERVVGLAARLGGNVRSGLVAEKVFPSEAAFDEFMGQILRERTLDLFSHPRAQFTFAPKDVSAMRQVAFPSTTPDVILEGCRRMTDIAQVSDALMDDDSAPQRNDRPAVTLESLHMAPAEGYVMSLVTGGSTIDEICRVSPLGRDETIRLLYALLVLDLIRHPRLAGQRFSAAELALRRARSSDRDKADRELIENEYARIKGLEMFSIIPGAGSLSLPDLRRAVKAYQETWKTDRFTPRAARDMRDQLAILQGRAGELLLAAMQAEGRQAMSSSPASSGEASGEGEEGGEDRFKRLEFTKSASQEKLEVAQREAERYYAKAMEAFRAKDYHATVQMAREALRRDETARYQALLADALAMNPHWGKKAEEAYQRAMELDKYDARLPLALGRIYLRAGLKNRAREQFEAALAIQPEMEEARQALREAGR